MDEVLRELFVVLGMKTEEKDFEKAMLKVEAIKKGLELLVDFVKEGTAKLFEMFEGVAKEGAELEHLAARTGLSTDALQSLGAAAGAVGADLGTVTMGARGLSLAMYEASRGSAEAHDAFAKLGVRVTDATGKLRPLEEVMTEVGEKFATMPAGAEKLALASKLFSRGGGQMILVLEKMAHWSAEAKDAGAVMSEEMIENAGKLHDSMYGLELSFKGLRNSIVEPLLEPLSHLIDMFSTWVRANRQLIATRVGDFFRAIGSGLSIVWRLLKPVRVLFDAFLHSATGLRVALGALAALMVGALAYAVGSATIAIVGLIGELLALTAAEAAAAALPLAIGAAFLALVAIIALVAEDLYGYFHGKHSLIGVIAENMGKLGQMIEDSVKNWFTVAIAFWKTQLTEFIAWVADKFTGLPEPVKVALIATARASPLGQAADAATGLVAGHFLGGGASSPASNAGALAGAGMQGALGVFAPRMNANIQVQTQPGMDNMGVAAATRNALDDWWSTKVEEAFAATVGGK